MSINKQGINKSRDEILDLIFPKGCIHVELEKILGAKRHNMPSSLFKYCSFDREGYSLSNLKNDVVWMSFPEEFNDPYDCAFTLFQSEINNEVVKEKIDALFAKTNQILENGLQDRIKKGVLISCFSEIKDSMLMWSHYAGRHKGFCTEYAIAEEPTYKKFLSPVIYATNILSASEYLDPVFTFFPYFAIHVALTKSVEWAYEKEWRFIMASSLLKPERAFPFPKAKAIYLGTKIDDENEKELIEICKYKEIKVYKAQLNNLAFALEFKECDF
jgi:hypothetical protein